MMWLRDLVKETYGTDKDLKWDAKTSTATIRGASFKPGITIQNGITSYIYINNEGKMMVESSDFAKAVGLSGQYGSGNRSLSEEETRKAVRSEYANTKISTFQSDFKMTSDKYYWLDYNSKTIDTKITETTMHVSMVNGDAKSYILEGGAYNLSNFLMIIYRNQYGRDFGVSRNAIAIELYGHALPDELLTTYDRFGKVSGHMLPIVSEHTREADMANVNERWIEVILWNFFGEFYPRSRLDFSSTKKVIWM